MREVGREGGIKCVYDLINGVVQHNVSQHNTGI